jgi:ectoine hydroxylase-related dioxygenase (phytanoyl-CoA dioxygenase family)
VKTTIRNYWGITNLPCTDLGFADPENIPSYSLITQISTQFLTLQGAVAHTDMPLASGPTQLLPFSQLFSNGYLEYRQPENLEYFAKHAVQLPLSRGDGLFFNPALHHAAGDNTTNNRRSANLLQISSPFGRAMEVVDRRAILLKCWTALKKMYETEGGMTGRLEASISSIAEGYAFPTNLDKDPPPAGSVRGHGFLFSILTSH